MPRYDSGHFDPPAPCDFRESHAPSILLTVRLPMSHAGL